MRAIRLAAVLFLCLPGTPGFGALFHRANSGTGGSRITLRKRLHINTLITEPGTAEVDWSSLYSFTTDRFSMPSAFRYTPEGSHIFWGRTEYSLAFEAIASVNDNGSRDTQFSQAMTLTATSILHDGEKLDIAFAPQATFFLRDESGARLGGIAIARYDIGRNSIGGTAGWSGATHNSPTNPSGTFDLGVGYGRQLSGSPFLERFTPHLNAEWEKSTGQGRSFTGVEGIEYQVTQRLAFDISALQSAALHSVPDRQIAFGMTVSLGRLQ